MTEQEQLQAWSEVNNQVHLLMNDGEVGAALSLHYQLLEFTILFYKFKLKCQELGASLGGS